MFIYHIIHGRIRLISIIYSSLYIYSTIFIKNPLSLMISIVNFDTSGCYCFRYYHLYCKLTNHDVPSVCAVSSIIFPIEWDIMRGLNQCPDNSSNSRLRINLVTWQFYENYWKNITMCLVLHRLIVSMCFLVVFTFSMAIQEHSNQLWYHEINQLIVKYLLITKPQSRIHLIIDKKVSI